ncbi:MAG: transcription-repair coupling factor, partial [Muriicola sp.]|nr:transcription-repair coupling factor [Muriicola sp.]
TELNSISKEEELQEYQLHLRDRFGPLPESVEDLLNSVRIKWFAGKIGIEKVVMKKGKFLGYFVSDQQSAFYQSATFTKVLQYVQAHAGICRIKEKQTRNGLRLLLIFENVHSTTKALDVLRPITGEIEEVTQPLRENL